MFHNTKSYVEDNQGANQFEMAKYLAQRHNPELLWPSLLLFLALSHELTLLHDKRRPEIQETSLV